MLSLEMVAGLGEYGGGGSIVEPCGTPRPSSAFTISSSWAWSGFWPLFVVQPSNGSAVGVYKGGG